MRRSLIFVVAAGLVAAPSGAGAQRLRNVIDQLFIFGPGEDPLFLGGSATASNPTNIRVHGDHFVPSAVAQNGSVLAFLSRSLSDRVSNVPLGATGGQTFSFEGGVPVATSTSAGPIFAERATTMGKGRGLAGINRSSFSFSSLRGQPLSNLRLTFTHENVNFPNCSASEGADCTLLGVPSFENDVMNLDLDMEFNVNVTSLFVTYGLTDRIDLGVVLPFLDTRFQGTSRVEIVPFGGPTVAHFFDGTADNPVLHATRTTSGSAFGIGDVAARLKYSVRQTPTTGVALFFDARFPTGDTEDLLGTGHFVGRGAAIVSTTIGSFSPHINAGYEYHADRSQNDFVVATVGFDQLLGRKVTMAADVVGEFQVGTSKTLLPQAVRYESPFVRSVSPTTLPDIRDDVINGSFGFKFSAAQRLTIVTNAIFPLNDGGLRARLTYTAGLEYAY
jgi:hypothetical protein